MVTTVNDRVINVLRKNKNDGITAANLARQAKIEKQDVYGAIYNLRHNVGLVVNLERRVVRGKRMAYYKLAG